MERERNTPPRKAGTSELRMDGSAKNAEATGRDGMTRDRAARVFGSRERDPLGHSRAPVHVSLFVVWKAIGGAENDPS